MYTKIHTQKKQEVKKTFMKKTSWIKSLQKKAKVVHTTREKRQIEIKDSRIKIIIMKRPL